MPSLDQLTAEIERASFVAFRGSFGDLAKQAHEELDAWFDANLKSRQESEEKSSYHNGPAGQSMLSLSMHILLDVFGKGPTLDRMFESALTDPSAGGLIHHLDLAGRNLKLRGYNVRRMTGMIKTRALQQIASSPKPAGR